MIWTRTKVTAAAVLGVLLSAVMFLVLRTLVSRTAHNSGSEARSFKFALHAPASASDASSPTRPAPGGLADFTSNIPVIVLSSKWPGLVSGSKSYSSFKMEVYEPAGNQPARLGNEPTVTTRVGLRLHGMVSRQFPKLSYRLELQNEIGGSQPRALLGMPADDDWIL